MDSNVKIFDEYHKICRVNTLTLQQCNAEFNTTFPNNKATQNAWKQYSDDFENLKMQENVIEGEWLTEHMESFRTYLEKNDAMECSKRKFFIGTQSGINKLPTMTEKKVSIPLEETLKEEEELKLEEIPLDDAFKTPAEEVMNDIMKNKSYGSDFVVALKSYCDEKHIALESMIAFVPSKQALSGKELKEDFLRAHLFPNKDTAIETMQLWKKTLNVKNSMYDANELYILNIDKQRVKVGTIPYIFKDAEKYEKEQGDSMYVINLIGKRCLS